MKHTSFIALPCRIDHDKRNQGTWLITDVNSLPSKYFQSMIGRISDCRRPCFLKTQKYRRFFSQRKSYSTYWQRKEIYILRSTFRLVASEITPTEVWCIRSRPAERSCLFACSPYKVSSCLKLRILELHPLQHLPHPHHVPQLCWSCSYLWYEFLNTSERAQFLAC